MQHSTVEQVMTRSVVTAGLDTPYKRLVELLAEHRISALPIVDGDDRVIGVVSEGDLLVKPERSDQPAHRGFRHHRDLCRKAEALCARELMTVPAVTVPQTATVAEAARVVHSHHVKTIPVLDGSGRLTGIASRVDLLGVFLRDDTTLREQIIREVFGQSLWIDPGPLDVRVQDGVVTLRGQLPRRSEVLRAGRLTAAQDGVVAVHNYLTHDFDDVQHESMVQPNW